MNGPPLISVLIPAFNAERTLAESLESVRSQTFADFEAIVVDDGSTDATLDIARGFAEADSRFVVVPRPHAGVSAARNAAVERARGRCIAFLDADDEWLPDKIGRQARVLETESGVNLVFTNCFFQNLRGESRLWYRANQPLPEGNPATLLRDNLFITSTVMVRRELLNSLPGPFDPEFVVGQDWDLWLRLAERGLRARGLREPLARYYRHPGGASARSEVRAEANVRVLKKRCHEAPSTKWRKRYARSLASARGKLELARARQWIESDPSSVPPAIRRAWRHDLRRVKWLGWYLAAAWPRVLGGNATAAFVHRKLKEKW